MQSNNFKYLLVATVCSMSALLSVDAKTATAADPETVSITFGLLVPVTGLEDGYPDISLSDYVGEQTKAVLVGVRFDVANTLSFHELSADCGDFPVGGTDWDIYAQGMIVNIGGPVWTSVYRLGPAPPEHSILLDTNVTSVCACWLDDAGSSVFVQDGVPGAEFAFFIVTGEFHVGN